MRSFVDLDVAGIKDSTVFLDVDGTLVPDGTLEVSEKAIQKVFELSKNNRVLLCSNGGHKERDQILANKLHVGVASSNMKKPSLGSVKLANVYPKPHVVIGDKLLTDGWFARRIGAMFFQVSHLKKEGGNLSKARLYELIDSIFTWCVLFLLSIRPLQQIRNLLIFTPLFFAGQLLNIVLLEKAMLAFVAFSMLVGSVYIFNDVFDQSTDENHPTKSRRPIASGRWSVSDAVIAGSTLFIIAIVLVFQLTTAAIFVISTYAILNIFYTIYLKHVVISDILTVSSFYVLRILIGGFATGIVVSDWLLLTVFFISLFLVTGKRLAEVKGAAARKVSKIYSENFLNQLMTLSATGFLVAYGTYIVTVIDVPYMIYSLVFVTYGLLRYWFVVVSTGTGESTERVFLQEPTIIFAGVSWLVFAILMFY